MKVAFLGTGIMGRPMVVRLLNAGHQVSIFNRTRSKTMELAKAGACVASNPQEATQDAQVIFSMLADAKAIEDVCFPRNQINFRGKTFIQMGTISPRESQMFFRRIKSKGGDYCECPVLGSRQEVESGTLILMFGGSPSQFKKWNPLLKDIGKNVLYIGSRGKAAAIKLGFNQMIASLAAGFCLSVAFVKKSGVDMNIFMDILSQSALSAPMFAKKLPRILKHEYENPNFSSQHMLKDVRLFMRAAQNLKINSTSVAGVEKILTQSSQGKFKHKDYISLYEYL